MSGLIMKDIIALKKYLKQMLFMLLVFFVFSFALKSPEYIGFMCMIFGSMSIVTSLAYDEQVGWNKLAFSMPLKRKELVFAKYVTWMLLNLVSSVVAIVIGGVMCVVLKKDMLEFFAAQILVECVYIFGFAILIPFLFKLGVEKGRIFMLGIFVLPTALAMIGAQFLTARDLTINMEWIAKYIFYLLPLLVIVSVVISYFSSVSIVKKKEW